VIPIQELVRSVFAGNRGLKSRLLDVTPLALPRSSRKPTVDWSPSEVRLRAITNRLGSDVVLITEKDDRDGILGQVANALETLSSGMDDWYGFVDLCTVCIHPVFVDGAEFGSFSSSASPGATWLINPLEAPSEGEFVSSLVHESVHHILHMLEAVDDGYDWRNVSIDYRRSSVESPWTGALIPVRSIVHAWLVWYTLWVFWMSTAASEIFGGDVATLESDAIKAGFAHDLGRSKVREIMRNAPPAYASMLDRLLTIMT